MTEADKTGHLGLWIGVLVTSLAFVFVIIPMYVVPDVEAHALETCEIEEQVEYYGP